MRSLLLIFIISSLVPAFDNPPLAVLKYAVAARYDDHECAIRGNILLTFTLTGEPRTTMSLKTPKMFTAESIRDSNGEKYEFSRTDLTGDFYRLDILLPRTDTFFVNLQFSEKLDTLSSATQFGSSREFILHCSDLKSWLPLPEQPAAQSASLEFSASHEFSVFSTASLDSTVESDMNKKWYFSSRDAAELSNTFFLCGSKDLLGKRRITADSLSDVSHSACSRGNFDPALADSLLRQMSDAAVYFSSLTQVKQLRPLTIVFIGSSGFSDESVSMNGLIVARNSPAYALYDSSILNRSIYNTLLVRNAGRFHLRSSDSTALFDEGWSGYLASKYLFSSYQRKEQEYRERLDNLIHSINFFPSNPLALGRSGRPDEKDVLQYKGRYFFFMLEYILGKSSFERVIPLIYKKFADAPVDMKKFQQLCEEEYGSPLEWFFQEWLNRPTVPEFVLQWNSTVTQRGMTLVTAVIEQRGDIFIMPVTLSFVFGTRAVSKRVVVEKAKQEFTFLFPSSPSAVQLDPEIRILRGLLDIRILAHARSSQKFRIFTRDLVSSEREAQLTLQLDPVNATGTMPIAYFSLGRIAMLKNEVEKGKEYFLLGFQSAAGDGAELYSLLCFIRYANCIEMEGNRNDALAMYKRASDEGRKKPAFYAPAVIEAEKYLREPFVSTDDLWYGPY